MNVRLTILLLLVLVLIGGSVAITQQLTSKEPRAVETWLYRIDSEDIAVISVTYRGEHMEYARTGDDTWVIKDGNDTPVFIDKWAGTPYLLGGPRSSRELDTLIDDPAKYGLEEPQTTIILIDRNGFPLEFHLGDTTPDGQNWYARLAGGDRLFTVVSAWTEVVSKLATEPPYPPAETSDEQLPDAS